MESGLILNKEVVSDSKRGYINNLYPLVEHRVGEDVPLEGIPTLRLKGRKDVALGGLAHLDRVVKITDFWVER